MTDDVLRLATDALGVPVSDPQPPGDPTPSAVLRCRVPTGAVVGTTYPVGPYRVFAREVRGSGLD